jgi:alanine-glyoxylate transaminase/serine-glyoxylate transaminase/serine-pyruvate transaminase
VISDIAAIRKVMDKLAHPALLMVDTISSLGSVDYRHDEWGADVTIGGSQKGLMLPPGLSFNAISEKALAASKTAKMPRAFWSWDDMMEANKTGYFPYTPATNLLFGLREAISMLHEEGLPNVYARHIRHGEATRRAARAWGLELVCQNPADYSPVLTAIMLPAGHDADRMRGIILDNFDLSLGMGLGRLKGKAFRIGHLGDFNDLSLMAALAGVEMGLALAGVPHQKGGVDAAMQYLQECAASSTEARIAA